MPYFTECLSMQMLAMTSSGYSDYSDYAGFVKDKEKYRPGNISIMDINGMQDNYDLYKGPLKEFLKRRKEQHKTNPVKIYNLHNNIIDEKKKMKDHLKVVAKSADVEKVPEIIARVDDEGKHDVVGVQFHPSDLLMHSAYKRKIGKEDFDFNLAVVNSSVEEMKKFSKNNYSKV